MRREFLVDVVSAETRDLRWVDAWINEQPGSAAARSTWGACAVQYAWRIRSGAEPKYVSDDQWKGFHHWLTLAEEQLTHATVMAPGDSTPWVDLLWSAVGLGSPHDAARNRWENLNRRNPRSELGAMAFEAFIGPRWNGDADLMWSFVSNLASTLPDGSPRWFIYPNGHLEQWVAERMAGASQVHASRYFQQPSVQEDIHMAYQRYLGSADKQSSFLEPQLRELFAGCFYLMGARDLLRKELEQLGPGIQTLPWGYLGSTLRSYQMVRESVGLK